MLDASRLHHRALTDWLAANLRHGWASCPMTRNGCPLGPAAANGGQLFTFDRGITVEAVQGATRAKLLSLE